MSYFSQEFLDFFKNLESNNNREWFQSNKKDYEKFVKEPFSDFISDLIQMIQKHDKSLKVEAKQCIYRIYRDVRFSKDKTPYKINTSAIVGTNGRKAKGIPSTYVELNHKHFRFYGGAYMLDKQNLMDIRYEIANDPKAFQELYESKEFKKHFGAIRGEKNKILPADLKVPASKEELIFNKQFYYFEEMAPNTVLRDDLLKLCEKSYLASAPMIQYLTKAGGYAEL